jgi:hypothetical protein
MPNQIVPDITLGTTELTDTVLGVKSGGDESLALLPYGADLAVLTAAAAAKLPLTGGTVTGALIAASLTATGAVVPGTTTTAGRPAAASIAAGGMLYDSDLAKIILTNGTSWTNVDGTSL